MKYKQVLAFYIRLSQEDLFKANGEIDESVSVRHQRDLLRYTYSTHTKKNEVEKQVIVLGCHEEIVTEDEFEQAFEQCRIMRGKRNRKTCQYWPRRTVLSGSCVCGYCNRAMHYEYRRSPPDIFYCKTTRNADVPVDENTCDCRVYEVDTINATVMK